MLSVTLLSFSRNFTAYHLFLSSVTEAGSASFMSSTAFSRSLEKISPGRSACFLEATFTASSISASRPLCFKAEVSTIGQFSSMESRFVSMRIFRFASRSDMFSAITTGIPVSISCVVKYRFLSIFVASTRSIITSGFSFSR